VLGSDSVKKLHFEYCMEIQYSSDVDWCCYTIKCIPQDTERQRVTNLKIDLLPETRPEWSTDSHGNKYIFGSNDMPHSYFKFHLTGDADCNDSDYELKSSECEEMIYRHGRGLTSPGDAIKDYYYNIRNTVANYDELSCLDKAKVMMTNLHEYISYEKGCTDVTTSAEQALIQKKGVCQDYAHILISLLNLSGCPARYVTGLIIGEGESHAWVEVASDGKWYGIDPTNNKTVDESYIKIAVGRDATECQINRGIMHGGGSQTQKVSVSVSEVSLGQKFIWKGALLL